MTPAGLNRGEVVVYQQGRGRARIEVWLAGETVWLSLSQMAGLFGRDKSVIPRQLKGICGSGELRRSATVAEPATVQARGRPDVTRKLEYFNLDAILSVGYRVNSKRGTQFRIWATQTLREHLLRGCTLNEQRLREKGFGEMAAFWLSNQALRDASLDGKRCMGALGACVVTNDGRNCDRGSGS